MAELYKNLVQKGLKSFTDVPNELKSDVKKMLEELGLGHLVE